MMDKTLFYEEVYSVVKEIPTSKVLTYGEIARLVGKPQYSRMVGQAMFHAPEKSHLPCHRVVNSQGRLVPSWVEQRSMLEKEGVTFTPNGCVDMAKHFWNIDNCDK